MRKDLTESEQSKFYPKRTLLWLSLLGDFPYPNSAQPILLTIQIPALNHDSSHNSLMSSFFSFSFNTSLSFILFNFVLSAQCHMPLVYNHTI